MGRPSTGQRNRSTPCCAQACLDARTVVDERPYEVVGLIIDGYATTTNGQPRPAHWSSSLFTCPSCHVDSFILGAFVVRPLLPWGVCLRLTAQLPPAHSPIGPACVCVSSAASPAINAGPRRGRERREAHEPPLFDGCLFHFHACATAFSTDVAMLETLVSGAGGTVVSRPELATALSLHATAAAPGGIARKRHMVVVADDSEAELPRELSVLLFAEGGFVVEESFIIESLEGYKLLEWNQYAPGLI